MVVVDLVDLAFVVDLVDLAFVVDLVDPAFVVGQEPSIYKSEISNI